MNKTNNRGYFIVLEGGEGSGKSTIALNLKKYIESIHNKVVVLTREPGGTPLAEALRSVMMSMDTLDVDAETDLMVVARKDHCKNLIKPAINRGDIVICDRYMYSNVIYQGYLHANDSMEKFQMTNEVWGRNADIPEIISPDLILYLDIEPSKGLERIRKNDRETNRFDDMDIEKHQKIREGFKYLFNRKGSCINVKIVNAEKAPSIVLEEVIRIVDKELKNKELI